MEIVLGVIVVCAVVAIVVARARRRPAAVAASSASARLARLPARELPGGLRVADARTFSARTRGLARLDDMPAAPALHFPRCRSVHTFTMRFPLDLVWLGADGRAVRVDRSVPPRRLKTCLRARSVVEVPAGGADRFLAAGLEAALRTTRPSRKIAPS